MKIIIHLVLASLLGLLIAGCGQQSAPTAPSTAEQQTGSAAAAAAARDSAARDAAQKAQQPTPPAVEAH